MPESEFKNLTDDPKIHKVNITAVGEIKKSFERVQTEAVEDDIDWGKLLDARGS